MTASRPKKFTGLAVRGIPWIAPIYFIRDVFSVSGGRQNESKW
jgi:hypothetical protein